MCNPTHQLIRTRDKHASRRFRVSFAMEGNSKSDALFGPNVIRVRILVMSERKCSDAKWRPNLFRCLLCIYICLFIFVISLAIVLNLSP